MNPRVWKLTPKNQALALPLQHISRRRRLCFLHKQKKNLEKKIKFHCKSWRKLTCVDSTEIHNQLISFLFTFCIDLQISNGIFYMKQVPCNYLIPSIFLLGSIFVQLLEAITLSSHSPVWSPLATCGSWWQAWIEMCYKCKICIWFWRFSMIQKCKISH